MIQNKFRAKKDTDLTNLIEFLIPSFSFLALILTTFILYLILLFLISNLKKFKTLCFLSQQSFIKIFSISLIVFSFFVFNFFSANLNTTNVVVNTNELLSSNEAIIEADVEICFFDKSYISK